MVYEEIASFVKRLPGLVARSRAEWEPHPPRVRLESPRLRLADAFEELHLDVQSVLTKGYTPATAVVKWLLGGTASAVAAIVASLMIPVFAFYLLYDFDALVARAADLIPPRHRPEAHGFFREVDAVLGQFFRGQFTVMVILAILYSVGYGSIGVPLALPIGIMAGLLSFIPYVGSTLALATALLMTALDWQGWTQVLWVLGVHAVIQSFEGLRDHAEDHGRHRRDLRHCGLVRLAWWAPSFWDSPACCSRCPPPRSSRSCSSESTSGTGSPEFFVGAELRMRAALPSSRKTRHVERHLDRAPEPARAADCSTSVHGGSTDSGGDADQAG